MEISLQVVSAVENQRVEAHEAWRRRLQHAGYVVDRARRRYRAVSPDSRLAAQSLEDQHEAALQDRLRAREDYERFRSARPREVFAGEREAIREAAAETTRLWRDGSPSSADHADILRLLIEEVSATVNGETEWIDVATRWEGGSRTDLRLCRPVRRWTQITGFETLRARAGGTRRPGALQGRRRGAAASRGLAVRPTRAVYCGERAKTASPGWRRPTPIPVPPTPARWSKGG